MSHLGCTLEAAFPLSSHLLSLAEEWASPSQRKGPQLPPRNARASLCHFPGSPCPPFTSTVQLVSLLRSSSNNASKLRALFLGEAQELAELFSILSSHPGWEIHDAISPSLRYALALLPVSPPFTQQPATLPSLLRAAEVTLLVSRLERSRGDWASLPLPPGYRMSLYPGAQTEHALELALSHSPPKERGRAHKRRGRRGRRGVPFSPAYGAAVMWRGEGCPPPLYSLDRPKGELSAEEIAAAEGAVRRGVAFSEWVGCAVLSPLAPIVRTLLTAPRRRGKSVWSACFEGPGRAPLPSPHSSSPSQSLPLRSASPCFWFCGAHARGEHFVDQVLSSADVILTRLTHLLAAARAASPLLAALPPLLLLDPAAGEGNYTQHLPDGLGRLPAWGLVHSLGWHAALAEPAPPTFEQLEANFRYSNGSLPRGVTLQKMGLMALPGDKINRSAQIWVLEADMPELGAVPLAKVARQRLQWASSLDSSVPRNFRRDLWQMDHLAGGPLRESLSLANASAATAFAACMGRQRRQACFRTKLRPYRASLATWEAMLRSLGVGLSRGVDLLVVDVRDDSVDSLLRAFPLHALKPSLIYYRHPKDRNRASRALRSYLMSHGYSTSAHWETSAWGELNIAWRSDRCMQEGMPGKPSWWTDPSDSS